VAAGNISRPTATGARGMILLQATATAAIPVEASLRWNCTGRSLPRGTIRVMTLAETRAVTSVTRLRPRVRRRCITSSLATRLLRQGASRLATRRLRGVDGRSRLATRRLRILSMVAVPVHRTVVHPHRIAGRAIEAVIMTRNHPLVPNSANQRCGSFPLVQQDESRKGRSQPRSPLFIAC